jgi:transcriptional regulator with XRE-family HTH domain
MKNEILYREALGHIAREERIDQGLTLRQVAASAKMALGYLSELERGQKEASSEVVSSWAAALSLSTGEMIIRAGILVGGYQIPDTVEELLVDLGQKTFAK